MISSTSEKQCADVATRGTQIGGRHYQEMVIQPAEYAVKNDVGFLEGTVIKYVSRHKNKNGEEDIDKAIHCLQLIKELQY